MENRYRVVECCREVAKHLKDNILSYMENLPYSSVRLGPAVYIMSDGSSGTMAKIGYCPFCGKQIAFCCLI